MIKSLKKMEGKGTGFKFSTIKMNFEVYFIGSLKNEFLIINFIKKYDKLNQKFIEYF